MQHTSDTEREATTFRSLEERNRVKLTVASRHSKYPPAQTHCSWPRFRFGRLTMEYSICMEVFVLLYLVLKLGKLLFTGCSFGFQLG